MPITATHPSPHARELEGLARITGGDPRVTIAVLDGGVSLAHRAFDGAKIEQIPTLVSSSRPDGAAIRHGTHVASILFGQPSSEAPGVAPACRGLIAPVFADSDNGIRPASQLDLARAITQCVEAGANIINISAGQSEPTGQPDPMLRTVLESCARKNILLVAAAGNDGCPCLHVPAAYPSVLVVGAMDASGRPLRQSNWGESYWSHGVLACGENVPGAAVDGDITNGTGTSYATPIVSGLAALLMSLQLRQSGRIDAQAVKDAILKTAIPCDDVGEEDCRRLLRGRLNVSGAVARIAPTLKNQIDEVATMSDEMQQSIDQTTGERVLNEPAPRFSTRAPSQEANGIAEPPTGDVMRAPAESEQAPEVEAPAKKAGCGCGCTGTKTQQLVLALGQLDYDFGTDVNRDAYKQLGVAVPEDRGQMLHFLTRSGLRGEQATSTLLGPPPQRPEANDSEQNGQFQRRVAQWKAEVEVYEESLKALRNLFLVNKPYAQGLTWLLTQDGTPIYALRPSGPFAVHGVDRILEFFVDQQNGLAEQVAIAGSVVGMTTLRNGQTVPVVDPDPRGMFNWNDQLLVSTALDTLDHLKAEDRENLNAQLTSFITQVRYEYRNLGLAANDRAINYAVTNLYQSASVYRKLLADLLNDQLALESITADRSPVGPSGSDRWDVKLAFFKPMAQSNGVRQIHAFTVDVSNVIPLAVGEPRTWYVK